MCFLMKKNVMKEDFVIGYARYIVTQRGRMGTSMCLKNSSIKGPLHLCYTNIEVEGGTFHTFYMYQNP